MVDRIAVIQEKKFVPSQYVSTGLIPPVVLILQLVESTLSSVGNIGGVFQQLNMEFDPFTFLKNYVPYIDWANFEQEADKYMGQKRAKNILGADGEGEGGF